MCRRVDGEKINSADLSAEYKTVPFLSAESRLTQESLMPNMLTTIQPLAVNHALSFTLFNQSPTPHLMPTTGVNNVSMIMQSIHALPKSVSQLNDKSGAAIRAGIENQQNNEKREQKRRCRELLKNKEDYAQQSEKNRVSSEDHAQNIQTLNSSNAIIKKTCEHAYNVTLEIENSDTPLAAVIDTKIQRQKIKEIDHKDKMFRIRKKIVQSHNKIARKVNTSGVSPYKFTLLKKMDYEAIPRSVESDQKKCAQNRMVSENIKATAYYRFKDAGQPVTRECEYLAPVDTEILRISRTV